MRMISTRALPALALAVFAVLGLSRPADAALQIVLSSGASSVTLDDSATPGTIQSQTVTVGDFTVTITGNAPPAPGTLGPGGAYLKTNEQSVSVKSTSAGDLTITESATGLTFTPPTTPGPAIDTMKSVASSSDLQTNGTPGSTYYCFQSWVHAGSSTTPTGFSTGSQGPFSSVGTDVAGPVFVPGSIAGPFSLVNQLCFHAGNSGDSLSFTGTTTVYSVPEPATFGPAVLAAFSGIVFGVRRLRRPRATA